MAKPALPRLRILTNMAFWQSERWRSRTVSLYAGVGQGRDPAGPELPWWREAWRLFLGRGRAEVVLTLGVRTSMAYGTLCLLTGRPPRQVMTEVFVDEPRPRSLLWRVKTALYGCVARRSIGVLTNSRGERDVLRDRWGVPESRLRFVLLPSTLDGAERCDRDDGFLLAAGRTLRDYPTLLRAVANRPALSTVIVGGSEDLAGTELPPHVELKREVPRPAYLDLLRRCRLVVLPLRDVPRSTGQVVLLEAMALGKPVVATRAVGTVDYIDDGVTGLLVPPGDPEALAGAIEGLWDHPERRRDLADQALRFIRSEASVDHHAQRRLDAVAELWEGGGGAGERRGPCRG